MHLSTSCTTLLITASGRSSSLPRSWKQLRRQHVITFGIQSFNHILSACRNSSSLRLKTAVFVNSTFLLIA